MAMFEVTIESLNEAASKISSLVAQYEDASNAAKAAADNLATTWVGDSHDTFVTEQEKLNQWCNEMVGIIATYIKALETAAGAYKTVDDVATAVIGQKH